LYGQQGDKHQHEKKIVNIQVQDYSRAMLAEVTAWKQKPEAMIKVANSYSCLSGERWEMIRNTTFS